MQNQHFFTYPLNVRFSLKADLTLAAPCQQQTLQTEERSALFRLPLNLAAASHAAHLSNSAASTL